MLTIQLRRGRILRVDRQTLPLVDAWLATQSSDNTRAAYHVDLKLFGQWCAPRGAIALTADPKTLVAFQAARRKAGDSDATIRRRWSSLSSFYDFAVDSGSIASNPVAGVSRPTAPPGNPSPTDVLTRTAVDEYLALAEGLDARLNALVSLIVFDGLKLGEALALDVDDVSGRPPKTTLTIRRQGTAHKVVLNEASGRAVVRCAGRRRGEPLFTSATSAGRGTRRLTRFGADHLIRQLSDNDSKRVTANALRRYFITSKFHSGDSIEEVQERAGLSDPRGVRRYVE